MMQDGSCKCSESEHNVLSVPPTMTAMQESQWIELFPIASLANIARIFHLKRKIGQSYHNRICMSNLKLLKPMVIIYTPTQRYHL